MLPWKFLNMFSPQQIYRSRNFNSLIGLRYKHPSIILFFKEWVLTSRAFDRIGYSQHRPYINRYIKSGPIIVWACIEQHGLFQLLSISRNLRVISLLDQVKNVDLLLISKNLHFASVCIWIPHTYRFLSFLSENNRCWSSSAYICSMPFILTGKDRIVYTFLLAKNWAVKLI